MTTSLDEHFKKVLKTVGRFKNISSEIDRCYLSDDEICRMAITTFRIPKAKEHNSLLVDVGGSIFWVPIYMELLEYQKVIILCRPGGGKTTIFDVQSLGLAKGFTFQVLHCDAELTKYPLRDGEASCVVSCELLEHLVGDPMNLISESNRILRSNGFFCLTTPNVISKINLAKIALGLHPFGWSVFTGTYADRHNREYTPFEVKHMFEDGGFAVDHLQTFTVKKNQSLILNVLGNVLSVPGVLTRKVSMGMRASHMLILGKKTGSVLQRYPKYLYQLNGANKVHFKIPQSIIDEKLEEERKTQPEVN